MLIFDILVIINEMGFSIGEILLFLIFVSENMLYLFFVGGEL